MEPEIAETIDEKKKQLSNEKKMCIISEMKNEYSYSPELSSFREQMASAHN